MRLCRQPGLSLRVSLIATACIAMQVQAESRIVGGTPVAPGNYPWMAAIISADATDTYIGQFCGGSLVAKDYVLTAAHCVSDERNNPLDLSSDPIDVVIGTTRLGNASGERLQVEKIAVHAESDIALLKLKTNASVAPVELLTPGSSSADAGTTATVIGWGATSENGQGSEQLLETRVPIVSTAACKRAYPQLVDSLEICAGLTRGGKDSCQGDSGGPLFVTDKNGNRLVQAGVVSHGEGCARPNFPGVYASVAAVSDWLDSVQENGGESGGNNGGGPVGENLSAKFKVVCDGLQCRFDARTSTAAEGEIDEYIWEIGPDTWKYGRRISHTYLRAGAKEVTLYVFQENGEYDYRTKRFSATGGGSAGLVSQQWSGRVSANRRVAVPSKDGVSLAAGQLQVILAHGRGRDFDLLVQKMNENNGRWQTLQQAATQGQKEIIRIRPSRAGQYRFIVNAHRGSGRFRVIAKHP